MDPMPFEILCSRDEIELDSRIDADQYEGDEDMPCTSECKKYQNENAYNKLLPYDISAEREAHLMRIKASLASSIQLDQEVIYEWFIDLER